MGKDKKKQEGKEQVPDSITVKELKKFVNSLPKKFDDFGIINGQYGSANGEFYFRIDKPVIFLTVDEDTGELCILHQSEDEVKEIINTHEKEGDKKEDDGDNKG